MQPKTILRGVLLHDNRTIRGHSASEELFYDIDLDSFPTAIETEFEGSPVTIYLKPGKPLPLDVWMIGGRKHQRPFRLDQQLLSNRAIRRGNLIRGKIPARNRSLHVFILTGVVGECYVVAPRHQGEFHSDFAECWHDALELDSYVAFEKPNFYFRDLPDAALFKMRWG
jgi:hypothetical protein